MHEFGLYFTLGRQHIADFNGLDHILFIAALCLQYLPRDWKKLLVLVTAFTIGHSITLALSVFNILHMATRWIEFLIPVTIVITALLNLRGKKTQGQKLPVAYYLALFFGFIHGLGFSNYLKSLLGHSHNIVLQLLAFNLGLEVGQLVIVLAILLVGFLCTEMLRVNRKDYLLFISGGILFTAAGMALQRLPF